MKQSILLAILAICWVQLMSQAPQSFNYQAVVRDGAGNPLINQNVGLRFTIYQGSQNGPQVFQQTNNLTTNFCGIVNLEIGPGNPFQFQNINWGNGSHFLEVELDPNGGTNYSLFGTKQLLSVPYALYANQVTSTGVNDYAFFQEKLTSGLPAGPFIAGQWQTRNLNTTLAINGSSIQRLNSTISMAPGTYEIRASAPGFVVKYHKARLQDVTHNITLLEGTSEYVNTSYGHQTRSFVEGIITIPSTIDFQLQHYCSSTWNSNGMGVASNFTGQAEIYSIIYIRRIN